MRVYSDKLTSQFSIRSTRSCLFGKLLITVKVELYMARPYQQQISRKQAKGKENKTQNFCRSLPSPITAAGTLPTYFLLKGRCLLLLRAAQIKA